MAYIFRITGKNPIDFKVLAATGYKLPTTPITGIVTNPLRRQVISQLKFPPEIIAHMLQKGTNLISFTFNIVEATHALVEAGLHNVIETLEETMLYFQHQGRRGAEAVLEYSQLNASETSYLSIFAYVLEGGRDPMDTDADHADPQRMGLKLKLYCQPRWHPSAATLLKNAEVIYNHDDVDANHINYVDILAANILGDVDAPVRLKVEFDQIADQDDLVLLRVARRSKGTPRNLVHVYEAELADVQTFWPDANDVLCSDGKIDPGKVLYSGAEYTGSLEWYVTANLTDQFGRFRVYARVLANTTTLAKFRYGFRVGTAGAAMQADYNDWKYVDVASKWRLLDMGSVFIPPRVLRGGAALENGFTHILEYSKGISDERLLNPNLEEWPNGPGDIEPDDWDDFENLPSGTGSNNREDGITHEGDHALKIIVADMLHAACIKGVQQFILSRLTPGITYTLSVWVKNAIIPNGDLQVIATGDDSGDFFAVNEGAAHANYTEHSVNFTPTVADTTFAIRAWIRADGGGNCTGTAYIDALSVRDPSGEEVACDFLLLLPEDEAIFLLEVDDDEAIPVDKFFVYDGLEDFPYWAHEAPGGLYRTPAIKRGELTLRPQTDNRLIFSVLSYDGTDRLHEVHGASTDLRLKVSLYYLPQYRAPLE